MNLLVAQKFVKSHILFLKPNRSKGAKTPDVQIDFGLKWEIKSPIKNGKYTIEHAMQAASRQSENIIMDLRNLEMQFMKAERKIMREFKKRNEIHRMMIITKSEKILTPNK